VLDSCVDMTKYTLSGMDDIVPQYVAAIYRRGVHPTMTLTATIGQYVVSALSLTACTLNSRVG
jgi:hypothetical protein